jgi:hypothetical protein
MSLTPAQQTAGDNLQAASDAALAVNDSGDGNYHRLLAAKCAGTLAAIELLEPSWPGFKVAADPEIAWSVAHPPR